jgi:uncharacterized protein YjiS (DUF1127 family)
MAQLKLAETLMRLADLNIGEFQFHNQAPPKGSLVSQPVQGIVAALALWRERARQRAELARLDHRARKDIGVSEADVWREIRKAPWES